VLLHITTVQELYRIRVGHGEWRQVARLGFVRATREVSASGSQRATSNTAASRVEFGAQTNTLRVMFKPLAGGTLEEYLSLVPEIAQRCRMRPNPSIERTASSVLRTLPAAAHVKR